MYMYQSFTYDKFFKLFILYIWNVRKEKDSDRERATERKIKIERERQRERQRSRESDREIYRLKEIFSKLINWIKNEGKKTEKERGTEK